MARKFNITKAEREKLKFSGMYMGATGSGKTVGALITAKGIVKEMFPKLDDRSQDFWDKIGVVDTEHNRAKIYSETTIGDTYMGKFLHLEFHPPFDVDGYIDAIDALKTMGCVVVIVDSVTHAWDDEGGILDLHAKLGGQFSAWGKIKPIMKRLYGAFTADDDLHIITTVRSKMKYEAGTTDTGKMRISKIGLKPVMRDDFEYEVLTALHFDEDHMVTVIKDNTQVFEDGVKLTDSYGKELYHFLDQGVDIQAIRAEIRLQYINDINKLADKIGGDAEAFLKSVDNQAKRKYHVESWVNLPNATLTTVLQKLEELDVK